MLNEDLMEQVLDSQNLQNAWESVRKNGGSAGIDGIGIDTFIAHMQTHWDKVRKKVMEGRYKPAAVKRVYIAKGLGKQRPLGIPTVLDRMLQQAILQVLQPIFEPTFSDHSYGFRPKRSAHDAVKAAQSFIALNKQWVVDIDLESFFDNVNHDLLMYRIGRQIKDRRLMRLIGRYLRSGVYENGKVMPTNKGVSQGGPLSPLLSNIYLNPLDWELETRGLSFCRYADDCNIYVASEKSAKRVFESVCNWIEKNLKVPVNRDKSSNGRPWDRQFLGYQPTQNGELKPSPKALKRYKDKVRKHFSGFSGQTSKELRDSWQRYVRGWCNYFQLADAPYWRSSLSSWTRRHIRKCFWLRWHSAKGRTRNLLKLGASPRQVKRCPKYAASWPAAKHPAMHTALDNRTLKRYGFWVPLDFATH